MLGNHLDRCIKDPLILFTSRPRRWHSSIVPGPLRIGLCSCNFTFQFNLTAEISGAATLMKRTSFAKNEFWFSPCEPHDKAHLESSETQLPGFSSKVQEEGSRNFGISNNASLYIFGDV